MMVPFLRAITLILCFKIYHTIKCTNPVQIQLSSFELTLTNIKTMLNELKHIDEIICKIRIDFDYITRILSIKFGQSMELVSLRSVENVYIHSTISFTSDKIINQTSIKITINLLCYSHNHCDHKFILEHVDRLIRIDHHYWKSMIRPLLLIQNDSKDGCTIGMMNLVEPCLDKMCSWYYSTDTKLGEGKCENIDAQTLPMLELNTEIRMFEKQNEHDDDDEMKTKPSQAIFRCYSSTQFWCEFNNCNNQHNGKLIQQIINQYYDLWIMYKVCRSDVE
ncbi:hypothetical protein I4U23_008621 [Adineta vaga]|nr:hypothetical protein I4U23_008621 [Adineta vaga]